MDKMLTQYLQYLISDRIASENTIKSYRRDLEKYFKYLHQLSIQQVSHISRHHIMNYFTTLQEEGKSNRTIARMASSIRSFHDYLLLNHYVTQDVSRDVQIPKYEVIKQEILTYEEIQNLLNLTPRGKLGLRNMAMLELLYATGLKVSELVQLTVYDVNVDVGYIMIHNQQGERRLLPLSNVTNDKISQYLLDARPYLVKAPCDYLFVNTHGNKMSRQGFWKILKQLAVKANLNVAITPQKLRQSIAVHLLQNGASIATVIQLLGNQNLGHLEQYLVDNNENIRENYFKYHPRAKND